MVEHLAIGMNSSCCGNRGIEYKTHIALLRGEREAISQILE